MLNAIFVSWVATRMLKVTDRCTHVVVSFNVDQYNFNHMLKLLEYLPVAY